MLLASFEARSDSIPNYGDPMSKIEECPTCGAKCKTTVNKDTGERKYQALQDEDAHKKIEQLKKAIMKKGGA